MNINYDKLIKKKISAVFFDLDGTLLDTAADLLFALNYLLEKKGLENVKLEQLIPHISKGSRNFIINLLHLDASDDEMAIMRDNFMETYHDLGHRHTTFFCGIEKVIASLNDKNIPWGIITNKNTKLTLPVVELFHFKKLNCKTVVCCDTTNNSKPHPDPMLKACAELNVNPSNCIFIGDAKTDVQAGKSVNMLTIAAAYGYIPADENVEQWDADFVIKSPLELLPMIDHIII